MTNRDDREQILRSKPQEPCSTRQWEEFYDFNKASIGARSGSSVRNAKIRTISDALSLPNRSAPMRKTEQVHECGNCLYLGRMHYDFGYTKSNWVCPSCEGDPFNQPPALLKRIKEKKVKRSQFAEAFRTDYQTIGCLFGGTSTEYTYKAPLNQKFEKGDKVYVLDSTRDNLKQVTVVSIDPTPDIQAGIDYKWIVGKADQVLSLYNENVEKDAKLNAALQTLERAMTRVSIKEKLNSALSLLTDEEKAQLTGLLK